MTMFSNKDEGRSLTHRPVIARRQLHASLGAVVVIALIAVAVAMSLARSPGQSQIATQKPHEAPIVKTTARETPSQRIQATDQAKGGRGS